MDNQNEIQIVDLLGIDRVIRRAYEISTSTNPEVTKNWHDVELKIAQKNKKQYKEISSSS